MKNWQAKQGGCITEQFTRIKGFILALTNFILYIRRDTMKGKWLILAVAVVVVPFVLNSVASALTYDFVGKDAKKWFDEFVGGKSSTKGGGEAGWKLTADGLTTDDNVGTGHQRVGISATWTDYTVETKFQYVKLGDWNESHVYVRWQDEANNYFIRTIKRNNAGDKKFWSIEWLQKIKATDNEGDVTDDVKILSDLKDKTIYGFRGKIADQTMTVSFFNGKDWLTAGDVKYPGTYKTGGVGVGRSSDQVAWQYISINGAGILSDATPVEALGKSATTWGSIKSVR